MRVESTEDLPQGHVDAMLALSRQARADARDLAGSVALLAEEARTALVEQVERRPYVTMGVAAGLGYVVGVVLPRSSSRALRAGGHMALGLAISRALAAFGRASPGRTHSA